MPRYIKNPITVHAEKYRPGLEDGIDSIEIAYSNGLNVNSYRSPLSSNEAPYIITLEGKHYISSGDYIITGIHGERYPCKQEIFLKSYTLID